MKNYKPLVKTCISQNIQLYTKNLVIHNFGNVSIRIDSNHFAIKPSGIIPNEIKVTDVPIIRISDSKIVKGKKKPSVDTDTHLEIYKSSNKIKSIVHTHSKFATSWAQSGKSIPLLGTTHSDYWSTEIPNLNYLSKKKINSNYEKFTGVEIAKIIKKFPSPFHCPGVILAGHGVFTWGARHDKALEVAEILEFISELAYNTIKIGVRKKIPEYLIKKHFNRKHGIEAYYGQNKSKKK